MNLYKDIPFRVMIENTNACNANCVFCPHKIMKRKVGLMTMGLYKRIIDECLRLGINFVTVYGFGEPLLDKYFTERIKYAKNSGIKRVTTNTNLMYLKKEMIPKLLESGIDEIYISFDAATKETYKKIRPGLDFKTVEGNILSLVKARNEKGLVKPEIVLSFVETDMNKNETKKYLDKWKNVVDNISISYVHNWTGDIKSNVLTKGKKDPCRLLWSDIVISWNGDVQLCCNDYENRIILGNVKKTKIDDIWGGKRLSAIRSFHEEGNFDKIGICKNCQYNYHHKSPWWVTK